MERRINPSLNIFKQYRAMNLINPFLSGKVWQVISFLAPSDFDYKTQNTNIISEFQSNYQYDNTCRFIYEVMDTATTLSLSDGTSYIYSEIVSGTRNNYTTSASSVTFTPGSTNRYVIVKNSATGIAINITNSYVRWLFIAGCTVTGFFVRGNLSYVHTSDVIWSTNFASSFYGQSSFNSVLSITSTGGVIGSNALTNTSLQSIYTYNIVQIYANSIESISPLRIINIGEGLVRIGTNGGGAALYSLTLTSLYLPSSLIEIFNNAIWSVTCNSIFISARTPPTIYDNSFYGMNKTTCVLHVPIGTLAAYRANQYWNLFTIIIADL